MSNKECAPGMSSWIRNLSHCSIATWMPYSHYSFPACLKRSRILSRGDTHLTFSSILHTPKSDRVPFAFHHTHCPTHTHHPCITQCNILTHVITRINYKIHPSILSQSSPHVFLLSNTHSILCLNIK